MNDFVVIKFVNGEMVMATLIEENDSYVFVENPIGIKVIQVTTAAGIVEKTATSPFCSLSEDTEFCFDRRQILYTCGLHNSLIPIYLSLVNSFSDDVNSFSDQVESALQRLSGLHDTDTDSDQQDQEQQEEVDNVFYIFPDEPKIH